MNARAQRHKAVQKKKVRKPSRAARRSVPAHLRVPKARPKKPVVFMRCRVNLVSPEAELVTLCEPVSGREVILPLATKSRDGGAVSALGLQTGQAVILCLHA